MPDPRSSSTGPLRRVPATGSPAAAPAGGDGSPGVDVDALTRWLAGQGLHDADGDGPLRVRLLDGGPSTPTYAVDAGERAWALRRPPLGHSLTTAHDVVREHRVVAALQGTGIPVPAPVALCTDVSVLGAPFALLERVEGIVVRTRSDAARLTPVERRAAAMRMMEVLAELHAVDPAAVGLDDLQRHGALDKQVKRWGQQLDRVRTRQVPGIDRLRVRLASGVPTGLPVAVLHGDYRLAHLVLDPDELTVSAVVGWGLATVGPALADVGTMLAHAALGPRNPVADGFGPAAGFPSSAELVAHYGERTGRQPDPRALAWTTALGCLKLAVLLEATHVRHARGMALGSVAGDVGDLVAPMVAHGLAALDDPSSVMTDVI